MGKHDQPDKRRMAEVFLGRALLLLFGLGVLGFLVAVDHADWFSIRPATGTSIAMAKASNGGIVGSEEASATAHP